MWMFIFGVVLGLLLGVIIGATWILVGVGDYYKKTIALEETREQHMAELIEHNRKYTQRLDQMRAAVQMLRTAVTTFNKERLN